MQKKIKTLLLVMMLLVTVASSVYADQIAPKTTAYDFFVSDNGFVAIQRYGYTIAIDASLTFSGGKASCYGSLKPSESYNTSVTATLYKKVDGNWLYINSWSGSGKNGGTAVASGSASVSGGKYKLSVSGRVKSSDGTILESPSVSTEKTN